MSGIYPMCLHLSGCLAGVERVLSTLSNYLLWLGLVLNIHQQAAAGAPEYVIVYLNMFAKIWININLSRGRTRENFEKILFLSEIGLLLTVLNMRIKQRSRAQQ